MASTIAAAKSSPPNSSPSPATPPSHTIAAILQYTRSAPSSAQRVLTTAEPRRSSTSLPPSPANIPTTRRTTPSKSASSPLPSDPTTRIARVTTSSESCRSESSSSSRAPFSAAPSRDSRRTVSGLPSHNAAYHRSASSRVGPFAPDPTCPVSAASTPGRSSPPLGSISPTTRISRTLSTAFAKSSSEARELVSRTFDSVRDMHGSTAPMMDAKCGTSRGLSPASDTNSLSQLMHVTRVNSSAEPRHLSTKMSTSAPRSAFPCADLPSPLISARKSPSAPSACCLISRLGSLSMFSSPSAMSGRCVSMSISGTESSAAIQPTKNCRTYGFNTPMRSRNIGANVATSNPSTDSVTMSFTSLSSKCAAFWTFGSASADNLQSASKVSAK